MNYHWNWGVFAQEAAKNQTYLDWLLSGALITLALGLAAWAIALLLGALLGVLRTVPSRPLRAIASTKVERFSNKPQLVHQLKWY
jgi:glutamate/aspartate transport system permease protein